jgi:hypothetical protein
MQHLTMTVDFAIIQPKLSQYCLAALKEGRRSMLSAGRLLLSSQPCRWLGGALFILLFSAVASQAENTEGDCGAASDIAILSSPIAPWKGAPLRVLVAAERPFDTEVRPIPGSRRSLRQQLECGIRGWCATARRSAVRSRVKSP